MYKNKNGQTSIRFLGYEKLVVPIKSEDEFNKENIESEDVITIS